MATGGWKDVSASDIARMQAKGTPVEPKRSKYRNVKCVVNGERFDSVHEADIWMILTAQEKLGDISELRRQVRFPLYCPTAGPDMEVAVYVADYTWRDKAGRLHVGDAKGQRKRICPYPIKAKWMRLQEGIDIEEL